MTREEAINEIKSWAIPSKKGREVLETLIPELRENKDENVKNKSGYYKAGKFWKASTLWNATRNKIPQRVSNRYILQECTWNIGTLQRFADEVKNVQEVSLDYPIILDMNGNIIDGAHRVVKAYLEGKDIDIVYIGDDEWPEPDYDEEKAVKESEDERIINQLITLVNSAGEVLLIPTNKEELVAWLNKCKESLHTQETCEENADSFTEDERIRQWLYDLVDEGAYLCERPFATESILAYLERQKEQKQAQTSEEKEYIRTIKSIISDFIRDKKPENLAYYQRIYDWLDGRHVPFSCGHENGEPVDPVFSKQEYESYPIISEDTTSAKPVELDGKTLLYTADKSYQIGFRDGVASVKPAECSKVTINGEPIPTETKSVDIPLAEWSEEDEEMMTDIIESLEYAYPNDNEFRIAWLKSLRPSWKPSEEQMKALDKARRFIPYNCDALESLYVDLKKL